VSDRPGPRGYAGDAAIALASGAVLLGALAVTDDLGMLGEWRAVAAGLAGGVVVEALFLAGTPVAEWWDRPWVGPASGLGLVVGAVGLALWLGPVVVAAACWGLATYFSLLVLAALGRWPFA
jgi:hypothetical protein